MNHRHGGARAGAGRKRKINKKIPYSTKLRPDLVARLKRQTNAAAIIESVLDNYFNKGGKIEAGQAQATEG